MLFDYSAIKKAEKTWGEKVDKALARFNLTGFREGQREIIMSIVGGMSPLLLAL